jgi:hypothetical protein
VQARFVLYDVWGRIVHPSFVIASCVFKPVFGRALRVEEDFSKTFEGRTLLNRFCNVF